MLTTKQVAERLNTNDDTVRHWCSRGHLPNAHKLGRDWVIPEKDLKGFVPPRRGPQKISSRKFKTLA